MVKMRVIQNREFVGIVSYPDRELPDVVQAGTFKRLANASDTIMFEGDDVIIIVNPAAGPIVLRFETE